MAFYRLDLSGKINNDSSTAAKHQKPDEGEIQSTLNWDDYWDVMDFRSGMGKSGCVYSVVWKDTKKFSISGGSN